VESDDLLECVAPQLSKLRWKIVFLGGATTHLLVTDPAARAVESTDDVDVIVDVTSRVVFQVEVSDALRDLGATEDTSEDAPLCRWKLGGITLDVMAPNEEILGFSNRWYHRALETAVLRQLPSGGHINVVHPVLFLATKLDAFAGRGKNDLLNSKDVEDIIGVLDGRLEIEGELENAAEDVRAFVQDRLKAWLPRQDFEYAVEGYVRGDADRAERLLARVRRITGVP
jgi:hypothetical protein